MISMFQCCLRRTLLTCGIIVASASFGAGQTVEPANDSAAQKTQAAQNYAKLPLSFEANQGQADKTVKFLSTGRGYSLFLTDSSAVLALTKRDAANALPARTTKY